MIERQTQSVAYWQSFSITQRDTEFLHDLMLDAGRPLTAQALALALIGERCRQEESNLRSELARGTLFQPKKRFGVGDKVIFPALDYRLGEVVGIRAGENPEYGPFDVLAVDFGPDRRQRSYAASLSAPHKLNADTPDLLLSQPAVPPEKLLATVAAQVPGSLSTQLALNPDLARFEDFWLLRDQMASIHVGHLNIAEAAIEIRAAPVETTTLVKEMELPAEISPEVVAFSLQSAMTVDGRFDQVGPGEIRSWYLCRMEPAEALHVPELLRIEPAVYDRDALTPELFQLDWELDDEWSDTGDTAAPGVKPSGPASITLLLIYPHLASGTLPLNKHSRSFFPHGHGERTLVTLVDGRWGQRFSGWVVHNGRYIAGLRHMFEQHKLPAGALITLERRDDSGEIYVDYRPRRMRREWTRRAQLIEDNRLDIQLRKQEVSCEYDELAIIGDDRPEDVLKLRANPLYAHAPLSELVYEVLEDLAGLSGSVHAKTVYSAVNVLRRCSPGPILAALATDRRLVNLGDCLFQLRG